MHRLLSSLALSVALTAPTAVAQIAPWSEAEQGVLANHVQLTFQDRFVKAGESYFSPDDSKIIFQAVETPETGDEPDPFYAMFVADVVYEGDGRISGIENIQRISPPGSANTCGWFHPTDPDVVIFGSTIDPPTATSPPGFQRESSRYKWMFPPEMTIVKCDLREADGTADTLEVLIENPQAYLAECSLSTDRRFLLYCSLESNEGDIFVNDLVEGTRTRLVSARGYDGGPFFSPDGRRICYRSDREGTNLLQVFVGELALNESGGIVGVEREFQLTNNQHVNWAPYWHPSGRYLVYTTSEMGHRNYEVFVLDADSGVLPDSDGPVRYGTRKRRVTHADGFDGLPAFNSDGSLMMWTSQRGEDGESQLWVADFLLDLDATPQPDVGQVDQSTDSDGATEKDAYITIQDPETGNIFLYDPATHELFLYNARTHRKTPVTDEAQLKRAMELFRRK